MATDGQPRRGLLQRIELVGAELARRWRAREHDPQHFAALAVEVATEARLDQGFALAELGAAILGGQSTPNLGHQGILSEQSFSDGAFTVYRHPGFRIEVLVWVDGSVAIHDHQWSGAFQVLAGSSLHSEYAFQTRGGAGPYLAFGELTRSCFESLAPGDARPVQRTTGPGSVPSHRLFHLDRPSVSLAISHYPAHGGMQYEFLEPGIALESFTSVTPDLQPTMKVLTLMGRLGDPALADRVCELVLELDDRGAFRLAQAFQPVLERLGRGAELVAALERRFPAQLDVLERAHHAQRRAQHIAALRAQIHDPEQRFLLAVLLSARDRSDCFTAIRARHPQDDPATVVGRWLADAVKLREVLPDGAATLELVTRARTQASADAALRELVAAAGRELAAEQRRAFDELVQRARSPIMAPLFAVA